MWQGEGQKAPREPKGHLLAREVVLRPAVHQDLEGTDGKCRPLGFTRPPPPHESDTRPKVRPAQTRGSGKR